MTPSRLRRLLTVPLALAALQLPARDFTQEPPEEKAGRMAWFEEARFGMFIHWGLYSVAAGEVNGRRIGGAGEWIMETGHVPVSEYEQLVPKFNPVKFNAGEWVRTAKTAGMKYIVITSKHHDGFGIWRSAANPSWSMTATPYAGDPLKDLATACREQGLVFCLYHSIMDWRHPDWGTRRAWNDRATGTPDMDRYTAYLKGQLKELLGGDYGRIGIVWFDGEWESPWNHERGVDLYNFCRGLQPETIVNNRVGKGRSGMEGMDKGNAVGDYGTPEQQIPATGFGPGVRWESCMTMNGTWGFRKDDHGWKSATTLVRNLVDCASKGGNYLLNVGPTGEGLIPFPSVARLQQVGEWMRVNSESIYGTTASPFRQLGFNGRATTRGSRLYLHVFETPADQVLRLDGLSTRVKEAWLLADSSKTALRVEQDEQGARIVMADYPAATIDPHATVIVAELDGPPAVDDSIRAAADGSIALPARLAKVEGAGTARYQGGADNDNIGFWSNPADAAAWEFKLGRPGRYAVKLTYAALPTSAGGSFTMAAGGQSVTGAVESTGSWTTFAEKNGGTLALDQAGTVKLIVKPVSIKGEGLMNLRAVRLIAE